MVVNTKADTKIRGNSDQRLRLSTQKLGSRKRSTKRILEWDSITGGFFGQKITTVIDAGAKEYVMSETLTRNGPFHAKKRPGERLLQQTHLDFSDAMLVMREKDFGEDRRRRPLYY